ncbi:hypothetical protein OKW42_002223 [Paraburkholderia sp. WC7.3d]
MGRTEWKTAGPLDRWAGSKRLSHLAAIQDGEPARIACGSAPYFADFSDQTLVWVASGPGPRDASDVLVTSTVLSFCV